MSQYPPQPPYNQPNDNNQYPFYPPQQPPTQYPNQSYPPGYLPAFPQPAQNTQYPMQPPQQLPQPPKKKQSMKELWNSGASGKCGVIGAALLLLLVVGLCAGVMHAATSGSQDATTSTQSAQNVPADTPLPTDTPVPTVKPKPTTKPTPPPSPAQLEAAYKASTTDTTVANLDKDGNADSGNEEHFTATLVAFVKDSTGTTAGANVTDGSGAFVQVLFTPGTDITQLNTNDTIEVWGTNQGVSSGTNAFGGTVQEVVVQANYLSDTTTGYKADS